MHTATLENVKVQDMKKRVNAYQQLYALQNAEITVKVKGYFVGKDNNIAFLQTDFYTVDIARSTRTWIMIEDVDALDCLLRPENDIIEEMQISYTIAEEIEEEDTEEDEEDEEETTKICRYCGDDCEEWDAILIGTSDKGDLYWCGHCSDPNLPEEEEDE